MGLAIALIAYFGVGLIVLPGHGRPPNAQAGFCDRHPTHWKCRPTTTTTVTTCTVSYAVIVASGELLLVDTGGCVATTFQWRRCDAAGNNCFDISGATASSYTLTGADAGSSLRVVADGVTSNPYGLSPTGVILSDKSPNLMASGNITTGAVVSTGNYFTTGAVAPYWNRWNDPDLDTNFIANVQADPLGGSRKVIALTRQPTDSPGGNQPDIVALTHWEFANTVSMAPGQDWWFSWEFMLPTAAAQGNRTPFVLGPVTSWNNVWLSEFHCDGTIQAALGGNQPLSFGVGSVNVEGTAFRVALTAGAVSGGTSTVRKLWVTAPGTAAGVGGIQVPFGSYISTDAWHRVTSRIKWATDSTGILQVWLDNIQIVDYTGPTKLFINSPFHIDTGYTLIDNYANHITSNSTVFFRDWKVGTTRSIVEQ